MATSSAVRPPVSQKSRNKFKVLLEPRNDDYDIVVFCHLRWEFVYQRPQHIISRLSRSHKILLIEEPLPFENEEKNTANLLVINENLHLLQPKTASITEIRDILPEYINACKAKIGWFYSPAFMPLLSHFRFDTVVYDCMDELTLFKGADSRLPQQEKHLLLNADVIFTGGKSLYECKSKFHDNVHCFPSSVDEQHFAQALNGIEVPKDISRIRAPIAGYFGVIDERIDFSLLEETALLNPGISFVMIGPLAKISEADLPRRDNIHYLGMKTYSSLPNYIKAFSVAIMPFAINDATRFISPTKTLEYMAAGKPIISTPVTDVVRDYGHCVSIVTTPAEFSNALSHALLQSRSQVTPAYRKILANTSWDRTVEKMRALIDVKVSHENV
jgi:glycosyltransferase involved in cell wall biosynthesis